MVARLVLTLVIVAAVGVVYAWNRGSLRRGDSRRNRMSLLGKKRDPDSIVLGRAHEVPAEIHYSSGSDRWWYHGPLWVQELGPSAREA